MNTFFSSTFVGEEALKEAEIYHPIKLEYYKHTTEGTEKAENEAKFGINIIKKEYKKEGLKIENKELTGITNDEQEIEELLSFLGKTEVMPIHVIDVLKDIENNQNSEFNIMIHNKI